MLTHKGTKQLETQRLILRRATPEDAQAMYENWASDPEVTKYLTWPTYSCPEAADQTLAFWSQSYGKEDFYQWMIVPRNFNQPIGSISVVALDSQVGKAEIGYCIGRRWWHKGIMTEALRAVIDFLFDEVGMNRIEARHDPRNPHSGGVMRKCGMKYEGTSRQSSRNNQGICDTACYSILRSEHSGKQPFTKNATPDSKYEQPTKEGKVMSALTAKDLVDSGICPTCYDKANNHIIYGDNSDKMLFENAIFECFLAGNPRSPGHTIISTKEHYKDMMEAPDEVVQPLFVFAGRCMNALKAVYGSESVYLCTMCDGPMNHFHVQLIPRYSHEKRGSRNFVKERMCYIEDKEKAEQMRKLLENEI